MGESENNGVLYLNGEPFNISKMSEITVGPCIDAGNLIGVFSSNRSCSFTGTLKYPKMSRKKFVCYLRKLGYSKKRAKQIAWYYNRRQTSYGSAYMSVCFGGDPCLKSYV